MRKLFVLLLIGAAAYYLYARRARDSAAATKFTLPESVAWKSVSRSGSNPNQTVEIAVVHGERWRMEAKSPPSPRILVAVFNGSQFASSVPKATAALDPRVSMRRLLAWLASDKLEGTEERNGHSCWRFTSRHQGNKERVWVDTRTRFPVFLEGTAPDGTKWEVGYSLLQLDIAGRSAEFFNTRSTSPIFSQLLTP